MTSINGSCDNARSTPWWTLTLHIFQTAFWEALRIDPRAASGGAVQVGSVIASPATASSPSQQRIGANHVAVALAGTAQRHEHPTRGSAERADDFAVSGLRERLQRLRAHEARTPSCRT